MSEVETDSHDAPEECRIVGVQVSGRFAIVDQHLSVVAHSDSAESLSRWAFARGALTVRHDYGSAIERAMLSVPADDLGRPVDE